MTILQMSKTLVFRSINITIQSHFDKLSVTIQYNLLCNIKCQTEPVEVFNGLNCAIIYRHPDPSGNGITLKKCHSDEGGISLICRDSSLHFIAFRMTILQMSKTLVFRSINITIQSHFDKLNVTIQYNLLCNIKCQTEPVEVFNGLNCAIIYRHPDPSGNGTTLKKCHSDEGGIYLIYRDSSLHFIAFRMTILKMLKTLAYRSINITIQSHFDKLNVTIQYNLLCNIKCQTEPVEVFNGLNCAIIHRHPDPSGNGTTLKKCHSDEGGISLICRDSSLHFIAFRMTILQMSKTLVFRSINITIQSHFDIPIPREM